MPEFPEAVSHAAHASYIFNANRDKDWTVRNILCDATDGEHMLNLSELHRAGFVDRITADCEFIRGQSKHQTAIWPPPYASNDGTNAHATNVLQTFTLQEISFTWRSLMLNFGVIWFQIQYLTHCSLQFMKLDDWKASVARVPRKLRYKVAIAFEFGDFVLVFASLDNVFQPNWAVNQSSFARQDMSVYYDYPHFIQLVCNWVETEVLQAVLDMPRKDKFWPRAGRPSLSGLAIEVVRDARDVFCGLGVYTACEVFHLAGLSPFITCEELFTSPSRIARLCEAHHWLASHMMNHLWQDLVRHCMKNGLLAPSTTQRESYADWLRVFAKDRTTLSNRAMGLLTNYHTRVAALSCGSDAWARSEQMELYDVFEPTLLQESLMSPNHLGHIVFGVAFWKRHYPDVPTNYLDPITILWAKYSKPHRISKPAKAAQSLLTSFFSSSSQGQATSVSDHISMKPSASIGSPLLLYLDLEIYEPYVFLTDTEMRSNWGKTFHYHAKKDIWTLYPMFPPNSIYKLGGVLSMAKITQSSEAEKEAKLFREIVKKSKEGSTGVCIGPLEYCGNAIAMKKNDGRTLQIALCRNDPSVPAHFKRRNLFRGSKSVFKKYGASVLGDPEVVSSNTITPSMPESSTSKVQVQPKKTRRSSNQFIIAQQLETGRRSTRASTRGNP